MKVLKSDANQVNALQSLQSTPMTTGYAELTPSFPLVCLLREPLSHREVRGLSSSLLSYPAKRRGSDIIQEYAGSVPISVACRERGRERVYNDETQGAEPVVPSSCQAGISQPPLAHTHIASHWHHHPITTTTPYQNATR
ncbi:hypothetical protein Hamer_G000797 [Homarus americanus]|uniref:Uncharacterized protein n=1 Tax=Homarus americanus TaxID=6706 RepID=A0A8J5N217_HOMAM|nr:hypothetical protein Hamer_G000797 [Homarus americanus]